MTAKRGVVIYNPKAGRGHAAVLRAQAETVLGNVWEWRPTEYAGHARVRAEEAAREGIPTVVAFGGDGTVGDVARGIAGSRSTLGIIPMGTGNDVARNLGLPLDLATACQVLNAGKTQHIDLGAINGTPFINNAGTGFDARVMQTMNSSIRFVRGKPAFVLAILKMLPGFHGFNLTIQCDDQPRETLSAMMLSILNGKVYGAGMRACPDGDMRDGELDVLIIKTLPKQKLLALMPKVIAGQHVGHPAIRLFRCKTMTIECDPPQPLNIDGDVSGTTPATIAVQPGALRVVVP